MTSQILISIGVVLFCAPDAVSEADPAASIKQAQEIKQLSDASVRDLIRVVVDDNVKPIVRERAIMMLGDLRAKDATKSLLTVLLFEAEHTTEISALEKYPAARALVKIGSPIYPDVWGRLDAKCSESYLYVLAFTMVAIDGQATAATRVKEKIKEGRQTANQQANQMKLLSLLEHTDFKSLSAWPSYR